MIEVYIRSLHKIRKKSTRSAISAADVRELRLFELAVDILHVAEFNLRLSP